MPSKFDGLTEYQDTVDVPLGTGVDGLLRTIKGILRLGLVQYVHLESPGRITYMRYLKPKEEPVPIKIDFTTLMPSQVIRRALKLTELEVAPTMAASTALGTLFKRVYIAGAYPIQFALHPKSHFWEWHERSTGVSLEDVQDSLYGVPVVFDEALPEEALFLCAAYSPEATMVDCQFAFKLNIPGAL